MTAPPASAPPGSAPAAATGPRRELTVAVLGCALGGAVALFSASQRWLDVTIVRERPLPPAGQVLTGSQVAPLVPACGLLLLAAAVALIAVRGAGRTVVGLLVAVAGGTLGWSGVRALTGGPDAGRAQVSDVVGLGEARVTSAVAAVGPVLALLAGVLAVLAGLLVTVRGRRWPGMGRRYERPGATSATGPARSRSARPETPEDRHQAAWKALDRGEDPTDDPTDTQAPDPAGGPTV